MITRLARVGYDFTLGYLAGGFESWRQAGKEVDSLPSISASEFAQKYQAGLDGVVVDVRKPGEFEAEHVEGALNLPLDFISEQMAEYPRRGTLYLHCAGGYRSMIAASILKARGFGQIVDVAGGFGAIAQTEVPRTNFVCPTTLSKN